VQHNKHDAPYVAFIHFTLFLEVKFDLTTMALLSTTVAVLSFGVASAFAPAQSSW